MKTKWIAPNGYFTLSSQISLLKKSVLKKMLDTEDIVWIAIHLTKTTQMALVENMAPCKIVSSYAKKQHIVISTLGDLNQRNASYKRKSMKNCIMKTALLGWDTAINRVKTGLIMIKRSEWF